MRISYFFPLICFLSLMNLMSMNSKLINFLSMSFKLINLMSMNLKLINLKLVVFLYFLVLFSAFSFFLVLFVLVKSYRKKKKFKTDLITSFILLLLSVGNFPDNMKLANITPVLKKKTL